MDLKDYKDYKLVVIIGPSGSHLRRIVNKVSLYYSNINLVTRVSTNTDALFGDAMSLQEFTEKTLNNEMIEVCVKDGWFEGTDIATLSKTMINIGVFDIDSLDWLLENGHFFKAIVFIYIGEPNQETFIRLLKQCNNSRELIDRAINTYHNDVKNYDELKSYSCINFFPVEQNLTEDFMENVQKIVGICKYMDKATQG